MTQESRFKTRADTRAKRIASNADMVLEYGNHAGDPDKVYRFGHVWVGIEHKRQGQKPRRLQEHRMAQLRKQGLPCFALAAEEDNFKQERLNFDAAIRQAVTEEAVERFIENYRRDAAKLRDVLNGSQS